MTIDDPFEQIVAGLEEEIIQPSGMISVQDLSDVELSGLFNETRDTLLERGEMQNPTTEKGRGLHSLRAACIIEIRRRKAQRT